MPKVDYTALNAAVEAATAAVTKVETVGGSAVELITQFSSLLLAEVTKALDADNLADQNTINAVTEVFNTVTARAVASSDKLAAAVLAGTPSAPPVENPPTV